MANPIMPREYESTALADQNQRQRCTDNSQRADLGDAGIAHGFFRPTSHVLVA